MKIYIYLAAIIFGVISGKLAYSAIYKSGWNAAVVEQSELIKQAKDDAVANARAEWETTAAIASDNIVVEERIVEVEKIVEKKIPQIVERIVEVKPECNHLGFDFVGLLNEQVHSGSDRSNGGADAPAQPHP
jgi:hypothetical protein